MKKDRASQDPENEIRNTLAECSSVVSCRIKDAAGLVWKCLMTMALGLMNAQVRLPNESNLLVFPFPWAF